MEVIDNKFFQIYPKKSGMDCFFAATLKFKKKK